MLYLLLLSQSYKDSPELKDPKVAGNVLLLLGKAALAAGDTSTAATRLVAAGALLPANPQIWRTLVDCHEASGDLGGLQTALARCVEVAESKGNYSKSRPLRLRLAEVQESLGDKGGALATLKAFVTNGKAVASPAEEGTPSSTAEDQNELMRLRCAALSRGLSGSAVSLPTAAPPSPPARSSAAAPAAAAKQNGSSAAAADSRGRPSAAAAQNGSSVGRRAPWTADDGSPSSVRSGASAGSTATSASASTLGPFARHTAAAEAPVAGWILLAAAQPTQTMAELREMGDAERLSRLSALCVALSGEESGEGRRRAAVAIAEAIAASSAEAPWVEAQLAGFLGDAGSPLAREGALLAIQAQCQLARHASEPFLVPLLPAVLAAHADSAPAVRHAAADAAAALVRALNPHAVRLVLPALLDGMDSKEWRCKVGALEMAAALARRAPAQTAAALPEIVPVVSLQVWDTHRQVQAASKHALLAACACIANPDIEPLVDKLVSVIGRPEETLGTLDALLATTFVSRVDCATLSVIAPLLGKCLRERSAGVRRKASRVISNMVKLVTDPSDVAPFVPLLLPALHKVVAETSDLEVVEVAKEALDTLVRALGGGLAAERARSGVAGPSPEEVTGMRAEMLSHLRRAVLARGGGAAGAAAAALDDVALAYVAALCTSLVLYGHGEQGPGELENWRAAAMPYLSAAIEKDGEAEAVFESFREAAAGAIGGEQEEGDAAELCNIEFSLAYGGKILLHNTRLRLRAGHR
jgi:elongation factor 3